MCVGEGLIFKSLTCSVWHGTGNPFALVSSVLGLWVCATTPGQKLILTDFLNK